MDESINTVNSLLDISQYEHPFYISINFHEKTEVSWSAWIEFFSLPMKGGSSLERLFLIFEEHFFSRFSFYLK